MPVDQQALAASLETFRTAAGWLDIVDRRTLAERIAEVLTAARGVLHVDGTGLMLLDEAGSLRLAGASDAAGAALETAQLRLGGGPGIDCVRRDATTAVDDLAGSELYADVWTALGPTGVRAVLSVPVRVSGLVVGTLNALGTDPRAWTDDDLRATEAYAGVLAVLLRLGAAAQDQSVSGPPDGENDTSDGRN